MPRRRRTDSDAMYFHVINRSAGRVTMFHKTRDYRAFIGILRHGLQKHPLRLVSYCVLPNHWHLIVGPVAPEVLSRFMHWVTTTHAVRYRRRHKTVGEGPVYQNRFKQEAVDSLDGLMRACRYVERNALQAGLVERAQDWPWGSLAARLLSPRELPIVDAPFLVSDGWLEYVNTPRRRTERRARLRDLAERPGAGGTKRVEHGIRIAAGDDQHQADAHVEGAKRLTFVKPARMLEPRKQRRNDPTAAVK